VIDLIILIIADGISFIQNQSISYHFCSDSFWISLFTSGEDKVIDSMC